MYAVNQKFIDAVKAKFADDLSVHRNIVHTHETNNNNQVYIRCKTFRLPAVAKQRFKKLHNVSITKENRIELNLNAELVMSVDDFHESLKWLKRNVRADSICISPKTYDYHAKEQNEIYRLLSNFVFGASRICARREIRLYSNIETKLLTSLVEKFWTLPQIECEIPAVVIYSFPDFDREKLNLGPNWILLEVDSEGAEFLHVLESGQNRMRISFCENLDDRWTIGSYRRNCYIKFYAIKPSDDRILS
ncbi:hypothetical protein DdX_11319 [Ditylenchus destructor]|uniref:Uncharacterized protein n=1 Tax=Ditylenchus destructor TaxID=166010 RepID=A0AAD4MZR9_9BILA|nr:hypothetical protein DdX_11319 [Ditylenchus destructor]